MDPLHICIALGPLAIYFLVVGLVNLRARPFITSGAQDAAALGVGVMGLVIAGPMELFFPESAAVQFGFWVWALLIAGAALLAPALEQPDEADPAPGDGPG